MSERLPVPPTKGYLMFLKEELSFAKEGQALLEQKKEALVAQITTFSTKADLLREKVEEALKKAYRVLEEALLLYGERQCQRAALACRAEEDLHLTERSFMGVRLPLIQIRRIRLRPSYGFQETGPEMDQVGRLIQETLPLITELAEVEVSLFRLLSEIRKTLKRLNALQEIYIPLYSATIKYIEESLEEKEREFFFTLKRLKSKKGFE